MRNVTGMDITIAWPSRQRLELCVNCIRSFYEKAANPNVIECIIELDYDDYTIGALLDFIRQTKWNIKTIIRHRSPFLSLDYVNTGAQLATGKFIWGLNDECEATTPHWDQILLNDAEAFLADKPDRLLYGLVDDDTHPRHVSDEYGCCFPIVSKEFMDCTNSYIPHQIVNQGGDVWLYKIFKNFCLDRILDFRGKLGTLHHSSHNGKTPLDNTQGDMNNTAKQYNKTTLEHNEMEWYRDKINIYRSTF